MTRYALGGATKHVRAERVVAVETVRPGGTITGGVHRKIKPRWLTSWQNCGDSGKATPTRWTLPLPAR